MRDTIAGSGCWCTRRLQRATTGTGVHGFNGARWKFASTMAETNPHSYTLRRQWERDEDFVWVVQVIRTIGAREKYPPEGPAGRWYSVLHLNGARFWTMNFPINYSNGRPCTILVNRKPPHLPGDRR